MLHTILHRNISTFFYLVINCITNCAYISSDDKQFLSVSHINTNTFIIVGHRNKTVVYSFLPICSLFITVEHDLIQDTKIECRISDGNQSGPGRMLEDESQYIGSTPKDTICPLCRTEIRTEIRLEASVESHLLALIFCVFYCFPCALVPYCLSICNNTNHYCPNCGSLIGVFTK